MKMEYREPVMEVILFAETDQIKASATEIITDQSLAEDQLGQAEGDSNKFVY